MEDFRWGKIFRFGIPSLFVLIALAMWGGPAYNRYQARMDAENEVVVTQIKIQTTEQHIEIEKRNAQVRVAEAQGIAESQRIIASSLTENYLQYLAIKAQEKMASSPNHTEVYIPSGANGIPLVKVTPEATPATSQ